MLKLTMTTVNEPDTQVYVSAKYIVSMYRMEGGEFTYLYTVCGTYMVRETPEQIVTMSAA